VNGEVVVTGTGSRLTGNIDNIRLEGPRALTGYLNLNGSADILAKLTVGGQSLYVGADLLTSGLGEISMDNGNGAIQVSGTVDLAGLRTDLTAGYLYVAGDLFVATPWSAGATVYLQGGGAQTVNLTTPGVGVDEQYFTTFYVANSGGTVTLNGPVYVTDAFYASSSTITGTGFLEVQGTFYASLTTFSGLPVRIDTDVTPGSHTLSQITFTNYLATDTQLYIRMPGSTTPQTLSNMIFSQVPPPDGTNGHYLWAENSVVGGILTIELTNPTPLGVKSPQYLQGTNTIINWP